MPDAGDRKLRASEVAGDLEPDSSSHFREAFSIPHAELLGDLNSAFLFPKHSTTSALGARCSEAQLPKECRVLLPSRCEARMRWQNLLPFFHPALVLGAQVATGAKATTTLQS